MDAMQLYRNQGWLAMYWYIAPYEMYFPVTIYFVLLMNNESSHTDVAQKNTTNGYCVMQEIVLLWAVNTKAV